MVRSKEYIIADNLFKLLNSKNSAEQKSIFNGLHTLISSTDLKGIEIYLNLENIAAGTPVLDDRLFTLLTDLFIKEFYYRKSILSYESWQKISKVIFCLQPLLYSFAHEREFFGSWNCEQCCWSVNF
ncbi:MAG: hypothetical protein IJR47_01805 [Clostridia bacterium]|nr:hypothetical protein [Clostridia bacterium]